MVDMVFFLHGGTAERGCAYAPLQGADFDYIILSPTSFGRRLPGSSYGASRQSRERVRCVCRSGVFPKFFRVSTKPIASASFNLALNARVPVDVSPGNMSAFTSGAIEIYARAARCRPCIPDNSKPPSNLVAFYTTPAAGVPEADMTSGTRLSGKISRIASGEGLGCRRSSHAIFSMHNGSEEKKTGGDRGNLPPPAELVRPQDALREETLVPTRITARVEADGRRTVKMAPAMGDEYDTLPPRERRQHAVSGCTIGVGVEESFQHGAVLVWNHNGPETLDNTDGPVQGVPAAVVGHYDRRQPSETYLAPDLMDQDLQAAIGVIWLSVFPYETEQILLRLSTKRPRQSNNQIEFIPRQSDRDITIAQGACFTIEDHQ